MIYNIEALLFASVSLAWLTVRQTVSSKWPLLDTWAVVGQGATAVVALASRSTQNSQVAQVPVHYTNLAIFVTYLFGLVLSQLSPDYAAGVTSLTCKCTTAGAYHTTLLFADSPWNLPLSAVTLALLLVQTILSAACTSYTGGVLESVAWVDMWNLFVLNLVGISAIQANCDAVVLAVPVTVYVGLLGYVVTWYMHLNYKNSRRAIAAISLLLTTGLDAIALTLAGTHRVVSVTSLVVFLSVPLLFSLRNAMKVSPIISTGDAAQDKPTTTLTPPASTPNPGTTPAPTPSQASSGSAMLQRIDPFVYSQSGYHVPQTQHGNPARHLFTGINMRDAPPVQGKKMS